MKYIILMNSKNLKTQYKWENIADQYSQLINNYFNNETTSTKR